MSTSTSQDVQASEFISAWVALARCAGITNGTCSEFRTILGEPVTSRPSMEAVFLADDLAESALEELGTAVHHDFFGESLLHYRDLAGNGVSSYAPNS